MEIFDYIKINNKEITELNTIDIIILNRLSYLHLENISIDYPIKIIDLWKYLKELKPNHNDSILLECLIKSNRFNNIEIKRFKHIENHELEEVFTGITISLPNNNILVAFRGTGKNPYDFKEDMNMSFKNIPSCMEGVKYLEEEKNYHKMIVSGHSKGGHIAMFSGCYTTFFVKTKIEKIYNFDGPGFLTITNEVTRMKNKIINYFPETSIVGRIMNSVGEIKVIKTKKQGIEAHNIYNWEYSDNGLIEGELSKNSDLFHDETLNILNVISKEKRESVINHLFSLMLKGEIKNIKELDLAKAKELIDNTPHLEKNEKDELMKFFKIFFKCFIPEINPKDKIINTVNKKIGKIE